MDRRDLEPGHRVHKSRPAAPTATPRRSPSGSAASRAIRTSRASTCGCWPERLEQPLRWRRPRMIFVNSMSDLFHEDVPDDFIARGLRRDGERRLAHLPGPHQAPRAACRARARLCPGRRTSGGRVASRTGASCTAPTTCARCRRPCASSPSSRCSGRSRDST